MPAEAFRLGPDGIYRCDLLSAFPWLSHGFGTRFASPIAGVTLKQIHSTVVHNPAILQDREEEGDGLVTDQLGLSIGVRTADCVPVLLCDARARAVAAVHAGWRGTAGEIIRAALQRMSNDFGTEPAHVHAAIGPCIQKCCYQVGPDVAQQFANWFPECAGATTPHHVDLARANRLQLTACGVPSENIVDSGLCTACHPDTLFSYRRQPDDPGRMVAAICRLE